MTRKARRGTVGVGTRPNSWRAPQKFLDVAKGFWHNPPFSYQGRYYEVVDGGFADALQERVFPIVYLGGTSDDALALSAKHADVHIFPIAPRRELSARIATLRTLAQRAQRTVRVGIETDVLGRHTDDGAWTEAQRQARGASKVEEHLWSGFGELKRTSELGLVGGYGELAHALAQYRELGVDTFIWVQTRTSKRLTVWVSTFCRKFIRRTKV